MLSKANWSQLLLGPTYMKYIKWANSYKRREWLLPKGWRPGRSRKLVLYMHWHFSQMSKPRSCCTLCLYSVLMHYHPFNAPKSYHIFPPLDLFIYFYTWKCLTVWCMWTTSIPGALWEQKRCISSRSIFIPFHTEHGSRCFWATLFQCSCHRQQCTWEVLTLPSFWETC